MKKLLISTLTLLSSIACHAQWSPAGNSLLSTWGEKLNCDSILTQYPRPTMERTEWMNLNGLWDYSIVERNTIAPINYQGKILVPFAIESPLSGVGKELSPSQHLYYHRTFSIPEKWENKSIILHFGAVDWQADVFINGNKAGTHKGGSSPFYFDITKYIKPNELQNLEVRVYDPTSFAIIPVGKQRNDKMMQTGMWWYPSVSGIWQTVWLEPIERKNIGNINMISDIDNKKLKIKIQSNNTNPKDRIEFKVFDGKKLIAKKRVDVGDIAPTTTSIPFSTAEPSTLTDTYISDFEIDIPTAKLWSPDSPFLYDVEITLKSNGKTVDKIDSYFAMRKISYKKDARGIQRMQLNNKFIFMYGPLDQGWWPDGYYTAPSDEALAFDIKKTKELGFNMIRKHVKVEPARWYMHCDKIGMLVWQDMPNCGYDREVNSPAWWLDKYYEGQEKLHSAQDMENFCREWKEIMDMLNPHPSIVVWIPFNEAWGQFGTKQISQWTKQYDPSRLVNAASGGNHYPGTGDMLDTHFYPGPKMLFTDSLRLNVIGEFGPCGHNIKGHSWHLTKDSFDAEQLKINCTKQTEVYSEAIERLKKEIERGCAAAIYCQTTDTFLECNGVVSFDRKLSKFNDDIFTKLNKEISTTKFTDNKNH